MSPGRGTAVVIAASLGLARATARADEPLTITALAANPALPPRGPTFSQRVADELTRLGATLDAHLAPLTFDTFAVRLDGRGQRARLRLGASTRYLSLRIVGEVHLRRGAAEVDAAIDLGLAGTRLRLELPSVELVPRSYLGDRYVELRVPLLRGSF